MYIPRIILHFFGIDLDTEQEQKNKESKEDKDNKENKENKKGIKKNFKGREIPVAESDKREGIKLKTNIKPVTNDSSSKDQEIEYNYVKSTPAQIINRKDGTLAIDLPKILDKGEDATPLLLNFNDNSTIIAVADGMGGAGGTIYEIDNNKRSGAYLASRAIISIAEGYFTNFKKSGYIIDNTTLPNIAIDLKYHFDSGLNQILDKIHLKGNSKLNIKSNLIKRLPTTFSLTYIKEEKNKLSIINFWAGDSRSYVLNSKDGLQQLTNDDLVNKGDALDNLINDSPLSNCIHADKNYKINYNLIECEKPQIVLVCTDGAFGYVQTPLHFEHLILHSLIGAADFEEWQINLSIVLKSFQADDISLSMISYGYENFDSLKKEFKRRYDFLHDDFKKLNSIEDDLRNKQSQFEERSNNNEKIKDNLNNIYKEITIVESDLDEASRTERNVNFEINRLIFQIEDKIKEIEKLRIDLENKQKDLDNINQSIVEIKGSLEEKKESYSKYKSSNKLQNIDSYKREYDTINKLKLEAKKGLWEEYKKKYEKYLK